MTDNFEIVVGLSSASTYDIDRETEMQRFTLAIMNVLTADDTYITMQPAQQLFFMQAPRISRKGLAKALRSIAYKIQHNA